MTTDERIDKLAIALEQMQVDTANFKQEVANFKQEVRQGFAVLTELHADTEREIQKMANSVSALADHVADHDTRLDKLEGK